jgi:ribonuclease VapC
MVVDTSAVVAILTGEPNAERCVGALDAAETLQMSAASVLEVTMVLEPRYGEVARNKFDDWLERSAVEVVAVTRDQIETAREGFRRFGKGRHPAGLNFGDCFSYGLSMFLGETLLFCGQDFSKTDVRPAIRTHPGAC